jgi:aspartate kinase
MLVMKFGGTSVGSAERMQGVLELVKSAHIKDDKIVVVLSAMSGMTNALIDGAQKAVQHDLKGALLVAAKISDTHIQAIENLFSKSDVSMQLLNDVQQHLQELEILYKGISYLGELTKRSLDAVSGMGELLSSKIVAAYAKAHGLNAQWADARQFIVTDNNFGKANPSWKKLEAKTKEKLSPILNQSTVVITQGFIGATEEGASTTLGRGGSDFSASIIGVALEANEIQIWTDVDGMMTADPRVVKDAVVLPEVSFQEASELAYFGAKVLHPLTIAPAVEKAIPVRILNTMAPEKKGTIIKESVKATGPVCAIASKKGIISFTLTTPRMLMSHGFLTRVFEVFDKHQTSIDLIATSEVTVSVTTDRADTVKAIAADLSEYGEVSVQSDVAIVTVVGRKFKETIGLAGKVFDTLKNINILMISAGASDINMSFVCSSEDADLAVQQLHEAFFARVASK